MNKSSTKGYKKLKKRMLSKSIHLYLKVCHYKQWVYYFTKAHENDPDYAHLVPHNIYALALLCLHFKCVQKQIKRMYPNKTTWPKDFWKI